MTKNIASRNAVVLFTATASILIGCKSPDGHQNHASHEQGTGAAKPYPLSTCIVSNEKLDDHGKPVVFVHQGQEIKLCCDDCREAFDKNPQQYLQQLTARK